LGNVNGSELLGGLELHDQLATDQEVDATFTDAESLVLHGERNLALESNGAAAELYGERFFVD